MGGAPEELAELVAEELFQSPPDAAGRVCDAVRERHGGSVAAVVFYGSCLRKRTGEGVLDFYVLVDDYRDAYRHARGDGFRARALAWANAALPPNVFYLELETPIGTLRAKYALMTGRDFERAAGPDNLRPGIWARFCQPALAVYARDDEARALVVRAACAAVRTALSRALPLLPPVPGKDGVRVFTGAGIWQRIFLETYAYEMRTESPEAAAGLVDADRARFEQMARLGLAALGEETGLPIEGIEGQDDRYEATLTEGESDRAARAWRRRRPIAKVVYLLGLLKSAITFGEWLPYALWKLERHTGTRIEPTERQRRHPFIWAWPILFRVLRKRELR